MQFPRPAVFAAGAITALVIGSGTAVAATGGKFILGKSNSASTTTVLKNTRGTALTLTSKPGTPALRVSNRAKVPSLNADSLDGVDSRSFALAAGQTNTVTGFSFAVDTDDDGVDDTLASFATCPSGTRLTGGGGSDYSPDGTLFVNGPADKSSWMVVSTTHDVSGVDDVVAYAVCYNPRGAVRGQYMKTSPERPSAELLETIKERLAPKMR